ncbi:uncharacterized protein LOC129231695 [Uloborus diversus]|uniref:uncharacterized protein LOC129231695 n=1 Tax=Uloborus diversus TaxID=327109 RepID=UPI002409C825|nr:uncharacterized protein LOC129231695 [Uloborus diversus]
MLCYLLFRCVSCSISCPVIRQLGWFNNPSKQITSLSFDSSGIWLLVVTQDATLYILPVLSLLETDAKVPSCWKSDNLTEIKLAGRRAPLTSVQWWQTHEGQHIAVIGSELGEISFINLINKKEVGGTYITSGISSLDILYDESHDTTYLLITGSNQQQWRLLLEEKKSNFYWPFNSESELTQHSPGASIPLPDKSLPDEKSGEQRPHRLSKFESGTFLTPQCGDGRNLVSAYNSSSHLLQVLEGDLDQMHLFSYKVPPECENIVLSDKLIFTTMKSHHNSSQQNILKVISRKFSEIPAENSKKREAQNAEVQRFFFNDEILALYKLVSPNHLNSPKKRNSKNVSPDFDKKKAAGQLEAITADFKPLTIDKQNLEGCIIVQKNTIWECRLRISPEELFLSLTAIPNDLPLAEKLGIMLGLDLHKLYEIAADAQLASGHFAQAVHLYQLSKCPQLKRVAHFMGYGYLSELIAYIQVLFCTKGVDIVSADKCHFANIALHCFAHQTKDKLTERSAITSAFKKFLKENCYYDEEVAAKLLAEQGLYELLHYFAKVRGQQGLMVETLLMSGDVKSTIDDITYKVLHTSGYEMLLQHSNDEYYVKCMTSFHLLQFLAAKPSFLSMHLQHLITLLPKMSPEMLQRVAFLYDPSRKIARLAFRSMASSKVSERYWSFSSLATVSSEMIDISQKNEELPSSEDIIKFFIFVLLMLCHKLNCPKFIKDLIHMPEIENHRNNSVDTCNSERSAESLVNHSPLSCGQAHSTCVQNGVLYTWGKSGCGRLGLEDVSVEYQSPQPVPTFLRLQINVLAVSCGALHTLALTDCGLFGWGSSRFGQLGAGDVQQTIQPIVLESLISEEIIKIKCGQYHSIAVASDGRVYTWGWGIHGQLGHGNAEDVNIPTVVKALKKKNIVAISAGQGHTVLLSKNGDVYTFGCGMFGQLGTGSVAKQSYPQLVNIPERIKLIASGHFHVLAISRKNNIYTWGCNPQALRLQAQNSRRARQHGNALSQNSRSNHVSSSYVDNTLLQRTSNSNGTLQQSHLLPNLVNSSSISESIVEASCGSHHSVLVTSNGEVYSWGRNSEGQVGNGVRKEQKIPSLIAHLKDRKIINAACGADFTIAMDLNGKLFGWGQNDGGQIGQRPVGEANIKSNSGTSSGRVITIRTNRRMITITQPCRQSILRPVEIILPSCDMKITDLDSGSFESEYSILKLLNHKMFRSGIEQQFPKLSNLDQLPYGPYAVHTALKAFHRYCDSNTLLNHCLNFGNFQAAAKLCCLENLYDQALEYQLKALSHSFPSDVNLQMALFIIEYYSNMVDAENIEANQKFLTHIIKFFMQNKLLVSPLESFFKKHHSIFSYPLCLIIFSDQLSPLDVEIREAFFGSLSSKFCLNVIHEVLKDVQQGCRTVPLLDEMIRISDTAAMLHQIRISDALTAWDDSIPSEHLWMDILRNMQTGVAVHSSIHLPANDVDCLAKSLVNGKIYQHSLNNMPVGMNKFNTSGNDAILFSCGHNYTLPVFHSLVSSFKESMTMLSYSIPQTTKLLLTEYQADLVAAACPKCVVTDINNEL